MKNRAWAGLLLVLLVTAALRIRLLETPLERDEGEYAYAGQLMLQAIPPYLLAANMKLPGTYAAYAAILAVLGESIAAIHLGLLLVNAGAVILIFLIGRRLFGEQEGLAAAAAYALLSLGEGVMGSQAHATHFVVIAALAGVLLLLREEYFWSGLLFGAAFVMKQHGILFGIFGAAWLCWNTRRSWSFRRLALYLAGAAAPFAATCLWLRLAGVFPKFWFWTFSYARQYATENSLSGGVTAFLDTFPPILSENPGLWLLAGAGVVLLWTTRSLRGGALFPSAFLVFSFLAVCPGLFFREHYFVLLLPAAALLAGAAIRGRIAWCILAAALAFSMFTQRQYLFQLTPVQVSRELYGQNPFPEAIPVAAYIRDHSNPNDRVAVLGSEPEIYFYSRRHSATSHIYMYGLMEPQPYAQSMQEEMIQQIEAAAPEFVVFVSGEQSWLREEQSPTKLFDWWKTYGPAHYQTIGIADIPQDGPTEFRWGADAGAYTPRSDHYLAILKAVH